MQRACQNRGRGSYARSGVILFAVLALATPLVGQEATILSRATTSRAAREDALRAIPFRSLSKPARQRILSVCRKPTMFRRMPVSVIRCDPEMHQFVIRHPETMVNVWQLMGITNLTARRTGQYELQCADGVGTTTRMELIYGDAGTHIYFCDGAYDGPLFRKPLTGRCVLVLKSGAAADQPGGPLVTNRLDVFLQVDHAGLDIFAKTLHPLLGKSADMNFIESMRFLERLSQAAAANGPGMQHMVGRLESLQPDVRDGFQRVVGNANGRALQRTQEAQAAVPASQPPRPAASLRSASKKPAQLRGR